MPPRVAGPGAVATHPCLAPDCSICARLLYVYTTAFWSVSSFSFFYLFFHKYECCLFSNACLVPRTKESIDQLVRKCTLKSRRARRVSDLLSALSSLPPYKTADLAQKQSVCAGTLRSPIPHVTNLQNGRL